MHFEEILSRYLQRANRQSMRLTPADASALPPAPDRTLQLYVHVPFCEHLCPFCSFHREVLVPAKAEAYFRALRREISAYHDRGFRFHSVYFGGGTPTVLPDELAATLGQIRSASPLREVSIETNPDHLREEVLAGLVAAGVDRLSVGIQSFDNHLLRRMDRLERYGDCDRLLARLKMASGRFETLNADMIFNLPGQTAESLARDLALLRDELRIDQVSFYPLMASSSTTPMMERRMGPLDPSREKQFYYQILDALDGPYRSASAWCFSRRPGMIDEYIVADRDYIGLGSGAFGYLGGTMLANSFSIEEYIGRLNRAELPLAGARRLDRREQAQYDFLMQLFGLRFDARRFDERHGGQFAREAWKELLTFKALGAIEQDGAEFRLTRKGRYYWVVMMREFFSGVNRFREQMIALAQRAPSRIHGI